MQNVVRPNFNNNLLLIKQGTISLMGKYEYICQTLNSDKDITHVMEDLSQYLKKNTNDTILEILDFLIENKNIKKNATIIERFYELFNHYVFCFSNSNEITKILCKSIKFSVAHEFFNETLEKICNTLIIQLNTDTKNPSNQNIANVIYFFGVLNNWHIEKKQKALNLMQDTAEAIYALLKKIDKNSVKAEHLANLLNGLNYLTKNQSSLFIKPELLSELLELTPYIHNSNPNTSSQSPQHINETHILNIVTNIASLLSSHRNIKLSVQIIATINKLLKLLNQYFAIRLEHLTKLIDSLSIIHKTQGDFTLNNLNYFLVEGLLKLANSIKEKAHYKFTDNENIDLNKLLLQIVTLTKGSTKNDRAKKNFLQLTNNLFSFLNQLHANQCTFSLNTSSIDVLHSLTEKLKTLDVSEAVILSYTKITEEILATHHYDVFKFTL